MGVAAGDFDNDGCRRSLPHQLRREPAASTTTATAPSPTSRRRAERRRPAGACRRRSSTTIATDGSTSTSAATCATPSRAHTKCFSPSGARDYCTPNSYKPLPGRLFHNNRNGTFTDVTAASRIAQRVRSGARRHHRRLQRRRLDRPLRRQRQPGEPALDQPARRHVQEHGAARGRRADAGRQGRGEHGRRRRRLRQRRRRGPVRDRTDRRGPQPLRQRRVGIVRRPELTIGSRAASLGVHRLRDGVVRLRQRRLARPADGQRRRPDHPGAGAGARSVSAASAETAVSQPRQRPVRGRDGARPAPCSSCPRSAAAPPSATSTTTATSTSSSPTTTGRCAC